MANRWFPPPIARRRKPPINEARRQPGDDGIDQALFQADRATKTIFQLHYGLVDASVTGPLNTGFALAHGRTVVTGSTIGVATGLSELTNAGGSIDNGTTATNLTISVKVSTAALGGIDLYVWMPTSSVDNTPIAATAPVTVSWWATGS